MNKWMRMKESDYYSLYYSSKKVQLVTGVNYWHPRPPQISLAQILAKKLLLDEREVSEACTASPVCK